MEAYTGQGGMKKEVSVKDPDSFTGVPIEVLLADIGLQISSDLEMTFTAIDNYSRTINASIIQGHVEQYDQNGSYIASDVLPVLILAYMENGECIGDEDGPVRAVFVAPEPVFTNSKYWIKQVVRVDIFKS